MAASSSEIVHDFYPLIRVYKDGRVERTSGIDIVPPSSDPQTGVKSKDVKISPDNSTISARLYLPKTAKPGCSKLPLLIYFHGGGFVIESAFSPLHHNHLNLLSEKANCVTVSVDYRLAPEHPLPIAYEDSWEAIKWVASHSENNGPESWLNDYADFNRVYFGGASSGGNLAHQMALKIGMEEQLENFNLSGIFLNCPYFWGKDRIGNEESRPEVIRFLDGLWHFVCPNTIGLDDPLLNPEKDPNLGRIGCKRVLVYVAEKDPLKERGWFYKEALEKTRWRGEVEVVEVIGEDHVFVLYSPTSEKAVSMIQKLAAFINQPAV